jgi:phage shock protein PspC (stress-responsive transcriptional regulator)
MNGNGRLYRSDSDAMIGGVAAGLGHYFKIDPTIVRAVFLLLMFASGGAFFLVYMLLWLLMPSVTSTSTEANQIINENINEMGARFRSFAGPRTGNPTTQSNGGAPVADQSQLSQGQGSYATQTRQGIGPQVLILIGLFFLLANFGVLRAIHWGMWWPLLLVGLGAIMLTRRNR